MVFGYRITSAAFNVALLVYIVVNLIHHLVLNTTTTGAASFYNLLLIVAEVLLGVFVANSLVQTATGRVGKVGATSNPYTNPFKLND